MPDATDPKTSKLWAWLTTFPQGQGKAFVALGCLFLTGVTLWVAVFMEKKVEEAWLWPWLTAITAVLGVSHLDFRIKRETYIPSPPNPPDVEDAQAGATTEEVPAEPATLKRNTGEIPIEPLMKWPRDFEPPKKPQFAQVPVQPVGRQPVKDE